ncbi:hypothetical protein WN943_017303 [Citrus x changshan-huyou]
MLTSSTRNDSSAQNDWKGAWWHNSFSVHLGFVEEDSPYASGGQKGTYYFEFSRPLRTMDHIQQIPEDPASRASHRWPIGFVTTGFVRGSKKPVAQAFCEAVLLALLREEQWNEMPEKQRRKEIYVLVRNLRSSAYRLALATIVLEQQEDDVNFL